MSVQQVYNSSQNNVSWNGSTLQSTYLYGTYWPALSETVQEMIEQNAVWNVGACDFSSNASNAYTCASTTTWTGKVGLIASYEYLYAAENNGTCWSTYGNMYDGVCAQQNWLQSTIASSGSAWVINPDSSASTRALMVYWQGGIARSTVNWGSSFSPVVYLKSTVKITGGNGQIGETNSYKLG